MYLKFIKLQICPLLLFVSMVISCGTIPNSSYEQQNGSLIIKTQIQKSLGKQNAIKATSFDSLVVEIKGSDFTAPIYRSIHIIQSAPAIIDTIPSIPSGPSRIVSIWTISKNGNVIHRDSIPSHTVNIEPGKCTSVNAVLLPASGSIFLQICDIPATIDSIKAIFTSVNDQKWYSTTKRSKKVYLSIDAIPHMTSGILTVEAINNEGVVVYKADKNLVFNAFNNENIILNFSSSGGSMAINTTIIEPGSTVASGCLSSTKADITENGNCIISEIMYSANDSEYIEIFNSRTTSLSYDTLFLEIDDEIRAYTNITIAPGDYYVLGRKNFPWVDQSHSVTSALDLSSNGNWITIKAKNVVLDQVIFSNGNAGLEWPIINGKRSIELLKTNYSAKENNFGRNWFSSTSLIVSTTSLYGTPGF